jgi:hypothetical protein
MLPDPITSTLRLRSGASARPTPSFHAASRVGSTETIATGTSAAGKSKESGTQAPWSIRGK